MGTLQTLDALQTRLELNLRAVQGRIRAACERAGRNPAEVRLVAVTKAVNIECARIIQDLGVADFGENRLPAAQEKINALGRAVRWHMIGNLQRRKARDAAALFDTIDAVDRVELAEALERRCEELGKSLDVLLEVNISGEDSKHGFAPENLESALDAIRPFEHLRPQGLLTMAPFGAPGEVLRQIFSELRRRAEALGLPERSMGMSEDFEIAVEEGATQVRIGTILFT